MSLIGEKSKVCHTYTTYSKWTVVIKLIFFSGGLWPTKVYPLGILLVKFEFQEAKLRLSFFGNNKELGQDKRIETIIHVHISRQKETGRRFTWEICSHESINQTSTPKLHFPIPSSLVIPKCHRGDQVSINVFIHRI